LENERSFETFLFYAQIIFISVFTIWARGVGPRFRPDQMSDLTWKDLIIYVGCYLIAVIIVILAGL
jgi:NADH:ubiquinone oxidoreductase subunit H